jgi:alkyl hydroperoxide reductase subunit AhpC
VRGEPVPDFTAQAVDGSAIQFSALTKGKTVVFMVWSAGGGIPGEMLAFTDRWARRYADQGVLFVGLAAYGAREDFDKWQADNAGKIFLPGCCSTRRANRRVRPRTPWTR